MRRAIGPIVTTGVALVVAGVVVANPIVAPRADVTIPAIQLSGASDAAGGMLDQAFLDAIAPAAPESTNPFSVLRQLITSIAADATYLGKNAIVNAFVAGVAAVSQPELTAASVPYVAPAGDLSGVAALVFPPADAGAPGSVALASVLPDPAALASVLPDPAALASVLPDPAALSSALAPVVQDLADSVAGDVGYLSSQVIAAAYAAGAAIAHEPAIIAKTLSALVKGDVKAALQGVVEAVTAPLAPAAIVTDAVSTVVRRHLTGVSEAPATASTPTPGAADTPPAVSPDTAAPLRTAFNGAASAEADAPSAPAALGAAIADNADKAGNADNVGNADNAGGALAGLSANLRPTGRGTAVTSAPARGPLRDAVKTAAENLGKAASSALGSLTGSPASAAGSAGNAPVSPGGRAHGGPASPATAAD